MLKIGLHRHGWNHALERRGWSQQPHSPSFVSTEPRRFERCKCHHRGTEERPGDQGGTGHCAPTTSFVTPPPQSRHTAHTFPLLSINKQAKSPTEPSGSLKTFLFFFKYLCDYIYTISSIIILNSCGFFFSFTLSVGMWYLHACLTNVQCGFHILHFIYQEICWWKTLNTKHVQTAWTCAMCENQIPQNPTHEVGKDGGTQNQRSR